MQTFLEPQTDLSALFEGARREGEVRIQRADGEMFLLQAETPTRSPLDVVDVNLDISAEEIIEFINESRTHL